MATDLPVLAKIGSRLGSGGPSLLQRIAGGMQQGSNIERTYQSTLFRPLAGNERRPNKDGSYSTEIEVSVPLPGGGAINVPSLWMGPLGVVQVNEDEALRIAMAYEDMTGNRFPRFRNLDDAINTAIERSSRGGTGAGPLAKKPYPKFQYLEK